MNLAISTDLDVDAPEKVAPRLRNLADLYYAAASELAAAWGDESAGLIWNDLAKILDRAATSCDKAYAKRLG